MKKLKEAATWMWTHRGNNIWWKPGVLTDTNPDQSGPKMTHVEAESVFRILEEERLIFPWKNPQNGEMAYMINEARENQWGQFLKSMSGWRKITRPLIKVFSTALTVIIWFISVLVAAVLGGFFAAFWRSLIG